MHHDNDRAKLFTRRALVLGGLQVGMVGALVARMYYLQVMEANRFVMLAEDNRISMRLLSPPRGIIVDRDGIELASNQSNYRVLVVAEQTVSLDRTLDALSQLIPLTEHDRTRVLRESQRRRSFVPLTIRENLTSEEMTRVEQNTPYLPGILIDVGQSRYYPLKELGSHVLGYVSAVSENDSTNDPLEELPGFRIGKAGVERTYDMALRGKGGANSVEVNAVGRVIRELERREGQPGAKLTLTLDVRLQEFASQRLGEEAAAAVVMDIHTGAVLVLASTPSFDSNAFTRGFSNEEWTALSQDPRAPLHHKAIAGAFAPGSTFKIVVALAALDGGAITPDLRVFCPGHMQLGNLKFHCWKKGGHGTLDLTGAMKHSCDVYFYEVARRVGIDKIAEVAKRMGLGAPTGIDLPNENPGIMPDREWKRSKRGQPWHPGDTLNTGIGQGFCLTTPLQLAVMVARLSNGGVAVVPHLARDLMIQDKVAVPRPQPHWPSCGFSPKHIAAVRKGMFAVSNEPGGTAYRSRITEEGFWLSGKTGTAQARRISMLRRQLGIKKNEDLPWIERDHALFVAYAPEENPRFAISVVIEHGGGGSSVAAPIARDIMLEVQKREKARIPEQNNER